VIDPQSSIWIQFSDLLICGRICLAGCEAYPLARMRFGRSLSERTRM
jgi:hypothetical protein